MNTRKAIIDEYVSAAEEYTSAFALGSEVQELLMNPDDPVLLERAKKYTEDFAAVKGVLKNIDYLGKVFC